ncbi:MAG: Beta-barrel assembly machine subunit BamA [Candidatus Electronema aureum]|uniref:Outer membrane protein assembly factor BamA n=1 Tax=Candidatus Electronema aureum TaxID=2005002 RepID=A0A521G389_9BACT|nr:MAG: Beta-barrel assembly machine subunit BamA [Candidatus Electronema aureum]
MNRLFRPQIPLVLLALLLSCLTAGTALAAQQNTVFLPLKINAEESGPLAQQADAALQAALASKNFTMLSRSEAEQLVDYSGAWPPPAAGLTKAAEQSSMDYAAAGSLTVIGKQISVDMQIIDLLEPGKAQSAFREASSIDNLPLALEGILTDILGKTSKEMTIASVAPAGNTRIDSGAILGKISAKPGELYSPDSLRKDLKAIFKMGYFDNVTIEVADSPKGKKVVFRVLEKPLISKISYSGLKELDEKDVQDAASIKANTILNPSALNDALKRINELYRSKGYSAAKSSFKINQPDAKTTEVLFEINEGTKMAIADIRFVGNKSFDDSDLKSELQTGTWKWYSSWITGSGTLKMDVLRQDADRLAAFYSNHGYIDAKVSEPEVKEEGEDILITFTIEEGSRYKLGEIDVQGDLFKSKEELLEMLDIRKEEFFSRKVMQEDILKLTDLYAEQGYAFAEVDPKMKKSESGNTVDITLVVSKGELVKFNRVEVQGNTRTRDNVIRRDLQVEEGGTYNSKAVRDSVKKLQRLGFFEDVTVTPQPTLEEDQMDILVAVKERATGQFSIGAGYSSSDKLMFMGEISEDNFLGLGTRLSFSANMSSVTSKFNLSYTDPRIFDSRVSAGVDAFNWEREYTDYTKSSTGGGLRLGHHLIEEWRMYYGYSWTDTTLEDISADASDYILESAKINITSAVKLSVVRDTRDKLFNTNSGSRNSLSVQFAGGPFGGEAEYTKLEGSTDWYYPLPLSTVVRSRLSAGKAFENEDGKLPVYDNFYLGGMNSIRGFKSSSVSPINPVNDEKYGGDKMWFANLELYFPLVSDAGLRGVVFSDFGNVYAQDDSWDFGTMKKSAGLGINWLSPMGPLRLVWGYNLDSQPGDEDAQWDFAMGGNF